MTDSLQNILSNKSFEPPEEIDYIKEFVHEKFGEQPKIRITKNSIIIIVSNASVAGALRVHLHVIEETLNLKKRLRISIG